MLRELPFFIVMFGPWVLAAVSALAFVGFIGKLGDKPKEPSHVDTPVEAAERLARVKAMLAKAEASRLAHHH